MQELSDLGGRLIVSPTLLPVAFAVAVRQSARIVRPLADDMLAELKRLKVDVSAVDPWRRFHSVDENSNTAVDTMMGELHRIALEANCAVELLHHVRKGNGRGSDDDIADMTRGARALIDAARNLRLLIGMTATEADDAGVTEAWRHFRIVTGKANYAPPVERSTWFKFETDHLHNDPDGGLGDAVGVLTTWQWPDAFAGIKVEDTLAVQQRIASGQWRHAPQSPTQWVGIAVAEVLKLNLAKKPDRRRINVMLGTWLHNGALQVVEREDEHRHPKKFVEVGTSVTDP